VAIGTKGEKLDKYLAFPFGVGVALVLDESALLLELDDVYWTEEGVLSVQIAFAAIAMLSALAYLIRMLRTTAEADSETDWELAAKAWDDLHMSSGGVPGIGI
jgi:glutamate/tyrosine decarboxylase-like PLP-dependent enzyme